MRASARLTRRHWWRTFGITALVDAIAIPSGPFLGVVILLLTAQSLTFIDITGSIVYTMVVPYAAIALTLYYFDLQARAETGRTSLRTSERDPVGAEGDMARRAPGAVE